MLMTLSVYVYFLYASRTVMLNIFWRYWKHYREKQVESCCANKGYVLCFANRVWEQKIFDVEFLYFRGSFYWVLRTQVAVWNKQRVKWWKGKSSFYTSFFNMLQCYYFISKPNLQSTQCMLSVCSLLDYNEKKNSI